LKNLSGQTATEGNRSTRVRLFSFAMGTVVVLWAGPATLAQSSPGAPQVGEDYQKTIDRAWSEAVAGEVPSNSCAGVKGRVIGSKDRSEAALRALFACNVDIPVRYFETYLDQVQAGDHTCRDFMMHFVTQISAMTMSMESMENLFNSVAEAGETDPMSEAEAQEATNELLTSIAADAVTEAGPEDPKRLVKNRLTDQVTEICPDVAGLVLR